MNPVVWAQSLVEYGVLAAVTDKVSTAYSAVEMSVREHTVLWVVAGVGFAVWIFRRR